jgi:hypothetical protein
VSGDAADGSGPAADELAIRDLVARYVEAVATPDADR